MLRHGGAILPHIGVGHRDSVIVGNMDEKVRRLAVKHATLGAILLNLHDEPIGKLDRFGLPRRIPALDDMTENLRTHRDIDGPVIHTSHLEAHFASGCDGGVFFVAHGLYSNEVLEVSRGHFALAIASLFWASVRLFQ